MKNKPISLATAAAIADSLRNADQDADDVSWSILIGRVATQIVKRCPSIDRSRFITRCREPYQNGSGGSR